MALVSMNYGFVMSLHDGAAICVNEVLVVGVKGDNVIRVNDGVVIDVTGLVVISLNLGIVINVNDVALIMDHVIPAQAGIQENAGMAVIFLRALLESGEQHSNISLGFIEPQL